MLSTGKTDTITLSLPPSMISYFYACAHNDAENKVHCIRDTEWFRTQGLILNDYSRMVVMRLDKVEMDRKRPVASSAGVPGSAWNILTALTTPHITGEEALLRSEFPGKTITVTNFSDRVTVLYAKQKGDK